MTMLPEPVYIIDGARTPFLKASGQPGPFRASDLAHNSARALLCRQPFNPEQLDEVILGCVSSGPDEANIARVVALRLGCGHKVPAWTVQRNCASGLQALVSAAQNIANGKSSLVLAGGTEAMSHHPVLLNLQMVSWLGQWQRSKRVPDKLAQLFKLRPAMLRPVIALRHGLTDPVVNLSMGQTAEQLALRFDISRTAMDSYANTSHQRLAAASDAGWLDEIIPLYASDGELYANDNGIRRDSSVESLARLHPVFDKGFGNITAGNSAQVSDGAAVLLLASKQAVEEYQLEVSGRIIDSQWAGLDPAEMGLGPLYAMSPIMQRQQLQTADIDYWEINEAFAAQVLACQFAWQDEEFCREQLATPAYAAIPDDRLNVDGGGISLGHPVGASGARIVLHLLRVLQRNNSHRGMASLCVGGGQGGAMLIENSLATEPGGGAT